LFPLPSSSYYDQNICSLPQQVPKVRVQPVFDQSPSTTAEDLPGACPALYVLQPIIKALVIQGDEVPRRMSHRTVNLLPNYKSM